MLYNAARLQVPELWKAVSYPSLRPLGSYLADLYKRLDMLAGWAAAGQPPAVFWLPGFFFVQSFLTAGLQVGRAFVGQLACTHAYGCSRPVMLAGWGVASSHHLLFYVGTSLAGLLKLSIRLACAHANWRPLTKTCCCCMQNFARKHSIPIDMVGYDFEMLGMDSTMYSHSPPAEGLYIDGLYLEGAGWDAAARQLCESDPKVLFVPAPVMWFRPKHVEQYASYQHYNCPMYRTADRRGVLATTGHSTNFVMFVRLPSKQAPQHWTMRGVALLTQLSS
jgi:hypothetical protein